MHRKRVSLTQTCPSAVGISLISPLPPPEHKEGDATGRQSTRSCSPSARASLQGSTLAGCGTQM